MTTKMTIKNLEIKITVMKRDLLDYFLSKNFKKYTKLHKNQHIKLPISSFKKLQNVTSKMVEILRFFLNFSLFWIFLVIFQKGGLKKNL